MRSLPSLVVKIVTVVIAFVLFFAITGVLRGGLIPTSATPAYDAVNNVAIRDTFQLVDSISFTSVFSTPDAATEPDTSTN